QASDGGPQCPIPMPTATPSSPDGNSWGDPHLKTFDRLGYNFQAVGEFILVRSLTDTFQVQTRTVPATGNRSVAFNIAAAVNILGDRFAVYGPKPPSTYLNGTAQTFASGQTMLPNGGLLDTTATSSTLTWPDGTAVTITKNHGRVNVKV